MWYLVTCLSGHKSNYVCVLPGQRPDQNIELTILSFLEGAGGTLFCCYEEKRLYLSLPGLYFVP